MASEGLMALLCMGALMAADPVDPVPPSANGDKLVRTALAVQTALQQGREQLLHGEYRAAVLTLESQLAYINGNSVYLKALEDAYRGYVKELRLAKRDQEAQRYLERLLYLDRGALLDRALSSCKDQKPLAKMIAPAKPGPTIRMKGPDERFDLASNAGRPEGDAPAILAHAEKEFKDRQFDKALPLYEQAHRADQSITDACRERWAYCKLFVVAQELKQADEGKAVRADLEQEVRLALGLAPRPEKLRDYGNYLLKEIGQRRGGAVAEKDSKEAAVAVRHSSTNTEGLYLAETANFRVFHSQSQSLAEQVAQVAERTRARVQQKWFGNVGEPWSLKCDIVLHATAQAYGQATGKYNLPGHSTLRMENGRLVVRRIDLHCDDPNNMLLAVLPHETTHAVLAGAFGDQLLPRWADEGMAVLSEPRAKVERHLDNLLHCHQDSHLIPIEDLVALEHYPQKPHYIGAFYAESVSLVEFLSQQKGAQEFTLFLQDSLRLGAERALQLSRQNGSQDFTAYLPQGMRFGFEQSLQQHYGYQSYTQLEKVWGQSAFGERRTAAAQVADGVR
jgi:hypothetical protein